MWVTLWRAAGASGDPLRWYQRLTAAYAEPHRRYHNHQHIAECLAELDDARSLTKESDKVEWALWFHDAIYDPRAEDNEEKSAALARECLTGAGLRRDYVEAICRLVMVTKSHDVGSDMNAGVMVDVDLAILGQPENASVNMRHRFARNTVGFRESSSHRSVQRSSTASRRASGYTPPAGFTRSMRSEPGGIWKCRSAT